jgi:hypothetical protein
MRIDRRVRGVAPARSLGARRSAWMLLAVGMLLSAACFKNDPPDPMAEPTPPTYVRVENQAFNDMNIYVLRGAQRVRLGTATGASTTRFRIPNNLIFGPTPLAFYADPIGGNRTPVSQEITVSPGDEVTLTIPAR